MPCVIVLMGYVKQHLLGRGLGAVIQLLLEDACIPFEYIYIDKANEWPSVKASLIASNHHFDCMPMIELEDGKRYSGCLPIMRFLSKKIGKCHLHL